MQPERIYAYTRGETLYQCVSLLRPNCHNVIITVNITPALVHVVSRLHVRLIWKNGIFFLIITNKNDNLRKFNWYNYYLSSFAESRKKLAKTFYSFSLFCFYFLFFFYFFFYFGGFNLIRIKTTFCDPTVMEKFFILFNQWNLLFSGQQHSNVYNPTEVK